MKSLFAVLMTVFVVSVSYSESSKVFLEAEGFKTINANVRNFGGIAGVSLDNKNQFIETDFVWNGESPVELWARVYMPWAGDDIIAVNINDGETMFITGRGDNSGRWDIGNFQVWYWFKIENVVLVKGNNKVRLSPSRGGGYRIDKIVFYKGDKPAWSEEWLTGVESTLFEKPATRAFPEKDCFVLRVEDFTNCDGEYIQFGYSERVVRIVNDEKQISTSFDELKPGIKDVWARVFFEGKNMFEGMTMEELATNLYFSINGELIKTVFEQNKGIWHWINIGKYNFTQKKNLISIKKQGFPVMIDKIVFYEGNDFNNLILFEKNSPQNIPFGYKNDFPHEEAERVSDYNLFGNLPAITIAEFLGEKLDNANLPVKLQFVSAKGNLILEKLQPLICYREEQQVSCMVKGDNSGVGMKVILKDSSGEYFLGTLCEKIDWTGWKNVSMNIPLIALDGKNVFYDNTGYMNDAWQCPELGTVPNSKPAYLNYDGNADGIPDFPIELTHIVIEKETEKPAEIIFGEPYFESPFECYARAKGSEISDTEIKYEIEIDVKNNGKDEKRALLNFGVFNYQYDFREPKTKYRLFESVEVSVNPLETKTVKINKILKKGEIRKLAYSAGPSGFKNLYLQYGANTSGEFSKFISQLEKENGAFRLPPDGKDAPLKDKNGNVINRTDVEKRYGRPDGFILTVDEKDICGEEYRLENGYSEKLKVAGMDLSDANGWPEIDVPYGIVGIDPESGRVKFHKNKTSKIRMAGKLETGFGVAGSVLLRGDYAYIAGGEGDYTVVNVSDPKNPRVVSFISNWYFSHGLIPYKDNAYFESSRRGLIFVDGLFNNPLRNGPLRNVNFNREKYGRLVSIIENKDIAVSLSKDGLWALGLKKPLYPKEIGNIPNAKEFYTDGGEGDYFTIVNNELSAVKFSNDGKPEATGTGLMIPPDTFAVMTISAEKIAVKNNKTKTVDIYSRKDNSFTTTATVKIPDGSGHTIARFVKNCFYLIDGKGGPGQYSIGFKSPKSRIFVYRIESDTAQLVFNYEDEYPTAYSFLETNDKYMFIDDYNRGLWIFDITSPEKPVKISGVACAGEEDALWTDGKHSFNWQTFGGTIFNIDVSDKRNPKRVGEFWDGCWVSYDNRWRGNNTIEGKDNFLYSPRSGYGIKVIDVSDPSKPKHTGDFLDENGKTYSGYGAQIFIRNERCYVIGEGRKKLLVYDVGNADSPKLLSSCTIPVSNNLCINANYIYTIAGTNIYVFEVIDDKPLLVSQVNLKDNLPDALDIIGITSSKGYLYLTEVTAKHPYTRLFIVNVKDPKDPVLVKRCDPYLDFMYSPCNTGWADFYQDIICDGDYLFVGDYGQIECYDIRDAENPKFVDKLHVGYQWSVGRKIGDYLYVPSLAGLRILEVPATTQIPKNAPVIR